MTLQQIVTSYLGIFPDERTNLKMLQGQIVNGDTMNNRKTLPGHATASALVLSPDKTKILMIYHKVFDGWYQPGGHWDPEDDNVWSAARREAEEETAVQIAQQLSPFESDVRIPLHISSHEIPERPEKNEPVHYHHDLHYVFVAADEALTHQVAEVHAAAWFEFDAPECANIAVDIAKLRQYVLA